MYSSGLCAVAGYLLHRGGQCGDLVAVALVGRRDGERQRVPQRVTAMCTFDPLRRRV